MWRCAQRSMCKKKPQNTQGYAPEYAVLGNTQKKGLPGGDLLAEDCNDNPHRSKNSPADCPP